MTIAEAKQFGPYRLIEKIGSGGMGEVYRALHTRLEREVALKLVSDSYLGVADTPSPASTPSPGSGCHHSHERFLREARSAATLNHPHVCSIYDTGEQDGRPFLVMELLRGETLKQYLAAQGGRGVCERLNSTRSLPWPMRAWVWFLSIPARSRRPANISPGPMSSRKM